MVIELRSFGEVEAIAEAGSVVAAVLRAVRDEVAVGRALGDFEDLAREVVGAEGARRVGGGVITTSVNDEIIGGVPGARVLGEGDLLSVAAQVDLGGWIARAAISIGLGSGEPLIAATGQALADGVAAARAGARLGEVSHAIGLVGRSAGYGVPPVGGHGIGYRSRQDPRVPNDGHPARGLPLRPGLVFTVEPIFAAGGLDHVEAEGPVVRTGDGSAAAHQGHTIAITDSGPRVLTSLA